MDLLSIVRTMWRFKFAAFLVMMITAAGCGYVLFAIAPVYETTASFYLVNPPGPPSEDEIREDPSLAKIDTDNPFLRFSDQSVIITVIGKQVNGSTARAELVQAGADPRYEVLPTNRFGGGSPAIDISVQADTAESAMKTAQVVGAAVTKELRRLQERKRVDPRYMITAFPVPPDPAESRSSGKLRALIGVLGFGSFLLLVTVSGLQAWERSREEKSRRKSEDRASRAGRSGRASPFPGDPPAPVFGSRARTDENWVTPGPQGVNGLPHYPAVHEVHPTQPRHPTVPVGHSQPQEQYPQPQGQYPSGQGQYPPPQAQYPAAPEHYPLSGLGRSLLPAVRPEPSGVVYSDPARRPNGQAEQPYTEQPGLRPAPLGGRTAPQHANGTGANGRRGAAVARSDPAANGHANGHAHGDIERE